MSNYSKLKTNLKLAIQRLKLLEKKKTELSLKARKDIADYLAVQKPDRARIRVEHIIREDNYVEAMEMLEMFCDLLLARFGLIEKMKELDPGLDEAISTVIWASPRISADVTEFKIISEILTQKYGKAYSEAARADKINNVNDKVKKRLGLEAPSKLLVEQYLIEIAKNFNIPYIPDNNIMLSSGQMSEELIQLRDHVNEIKRNNNNNGGESGNDGGASGGMPSLYPHEHKQVPLGFNEIETKPWRDLIDLESNESNNNFTNPPSLPKNLPSSDDHISSLKENKLPPPVYYHNIDNNNSKQSKNNPNAPLLPNEKQPNPMNEFNHSPPPTYNMDYFGDKAASNTKTKTSNDDDEDDLGLPTIPNSLPDEFEFQKNNSNKNDGSASIDYDDLTARFQNLKSFK